MQNGNSVGNKVKIAEKDSRDNKVQILLSEFIPEFNQAKFTLASGKTMILNIGQFYLEKICYPFDIPEAERCILKYSNTNELGNSFKGNYMLSCNSKYKIITLIPKRVKETGFTQNIKEVLKDGKDTSFQYGCSIPLRIF